MRDELIHATIMIQEANYLENVKKFKAQLKESKDPKQRVYSRLLKDYLDAFIFQRSEEKERELYIGQIDACLPIVDPNSKLEKKKSASKGKKPSKADAAKSG